MNPATLTLVEGGVLGHWQRTPIFDAERPSWFTVNGGLAFGGLGAQALGPYLFVARALRPFQLLPFTCLGSYETGPYISPYIVADEGVTKTYANDWYTRECHEFGRAHPELQYPCPCWTERNGHGVLFMEWLAERYPWTDGCCNGWEVVIFPRAINDLGTDFTFEERQVVINFRVDELSSYRGGPQRFVWDRYVNP